MYAKYGENPEQNRILRQLKDIFVTTPHWQLREVCKNNNWNLQSCIDQLMNVVVNNVSSDFKEVQISPQRSKHQLSKVNSKDIEKTNFNKDEERIGSLIKKGYRLMVLMRGPPGVGKSYLARCLVNNFADTEFNDFNIDDFICSADDYFYNAKGIYKYNPIFIPEAHEFNQKRVRCKTKSGLSPIFVDNTNMQLWEMLPYVKFGVQNNYVIEILEPKTPWRNSPSILAQKNKHSVPQNRVQQMLEKYEKGNVSSLIKMLKNTKYTKTLPQMRSLPPLNTTPINVNLMQANDVSGSSVDLLENKQSQVSVESNIKIVPKEQRTKFISNRATSKSVESKQSSARNVYSLLEEKATNVWKTYEAESADFWGIKADQAQQQQQLFQLNDSNKNICGEKSLLDLLREDCKDTSNALEKMRQEDNNEVKVCTFKRHSINCLNENPAFVSLRQIYPNKRISGLWDLFVKCNGDIDWAIDILLKEDELERLGGDDDVDCQTVDGELFECFCSTINTENLHTTNTNIDINTTAEDNTSTMLNLVDAKPQRQRARFSRSKGISNPALVEVKENIENCFVLGDDQYSHHLLKIRNIRSGANDSIGSLNATTECYENVENQRDNTFIKNENIDDNDDDDDNDDEDEDNERSGDMLEMSLGEQLIEQLVNTFRNGSSIEEQITSRLPLNLKVFMPRSLAKQLYMLWMESAYNHMEEDRQRVMREDEDFARLLKNPKYSDYKESPNNVQEILDMEYAWKIYNLDKEKQLQQDIDMQKQHVPSDLASHLTQMKLCESFPDIPRETLLDILATNGNNYNATVSVLQSTMQIHDSSTAQEHLMECARREQDLVNQEVQKQIDKRQERVSNYWNDSDLRPTPDEAKRLALREFEESRNLAAHHCQLKAECYQKTKEAIQSGNSGAAIYYSEIANLHKKKIDMYNHRAANCIMDVHKYTQNNPDLLDLHYLHLIEALGCLDLFLDRHITGLRIASRNYKHVFIITGRGKHSAGGVSTIKNKVKARLKERCLRWSEVNPGLLKVKIFSGSRHSKNI